MPERRYCPNCGKWVHVEEDRKCPECNSETFAVRRITDPEEVRKYFSAREAHKEVEEELIRMIAESGALMEGHFEVEDD